MTLDTLVAGAPVLDHADSVALMERQQRVLGLPASGAELTNVLTAVTAALEELLPECRASVLLFDAERCTLQHGAAPSLPDAYITEIDGMAIGPDRGSCGSAAHARAAVIVGDIETDSRWDDFRVLARPYGLRACWSSPILGRAGTLLGTFAVYHGSPHLPSARELRLVERFTHLASVAIEHDGLFGSLAESEERFRRAFEDNAIGMALVRPDGGFEKVNPALRVLLARSKSDLLARDFPSVLHPDDAEVGQADDHPAGGWSRRDDRIRRPLPAPGWLRRRRDDDCVDDSPCGPVSAIREPEPP